MTLTLTEFEILRGAEAAPIPSKELVKGERDPVIRELYDKGFLGLNQRGEFVITESGRQVLQANENLRATGATSPGFDAAKMLEQLQG